VFAGDSFECLKRRLQLIERLPDVSAFSGDLLQLGLGPGVRLTLVVERAVQMRELLFEARVSIACLLTVGGENAKRPISLPRRLRARRGEIPFQFCACG
jgi:hypothetical protein